MSSCSHWPLFSIVTPCFNASEFIEQTIASVLEQGYQNYEYIIIDGGSTDGTIEIIKKYQKHLAFWISEPDRGQADAIQKGLRLSKGDIFNWLNADDTYTSNCLQSVAALFASSDINVVAGRSLVFGLGREYISSGTDIYPGKLERTIGRARIDQPETFFRRSCITSIGGINTNLHYLMDLELWIRYLLKYGLTSIQQTELILANFRLHPESKTVSQASGFQREGQLLRSLILDRENQLFSPHLFDQLYGSPDDIKLDKIRQELVLHLYSLSYAQRDWEAMSKWRDRLLTNHHFAPLNLEIVNLELRRFVHSVKSSLKRFR